MLSTIGSSSSTSGISASYLNQLIQQTMAVQQKPLTALEDDMDKLDIRRSVYNDLNTMLKNLKTEALKLTSDSTTVLNNKGAVSSDTTVFTATALTSATPGNYNLSVAHLAEAHQVRSKEMLYVDEALGLSGTFVLGDRETRSGDWTPDASGVVTGGGTAALASGQLELKSGDYFVETREFEGAWQFRVVNADGNAVSIADADESGVFTSSWQSLSSGAQTLDTGRGLTINFSDVRAGNLSGTAAKVSYHAQGVKISVESTDTLEDIRGKINGGTYAEGERVNATIVNKQLVLTSANTGEDYAIRISTTDAPTGDVVSGLDLWSGGAWRHEMQEALNAEFTVNNISVSRSHNTGLDDVVSGVTLNLLKPTEGTATAKLTVSNDVAGAQSQVNAFISKFNSVTTYLAGKTAVTEQSDGTYTRGGLAGDTIFDRLRFGLMNDLVSSATEVSAGAPTTLREIGITIDTTNLSLKLSDSSALASALANDPNGVAQLMDEVIGKLTDRLDMFTGDSGMLERSMDQIDREKDAMESRKSSLEDRLEDIELNLTRRYAMMLYQLAELQSNYNTNSAFLTEST